MKVISTLFVRKPFQSGKLKKSFQDKLRARFLCGTNFKKAN